MPIRENPSTRPLSLALLLAAAAHGLPSNALACGGAMATPTSSSLFLESVLIVGLSVTIRLAAQARGVTGQLRLLPLVGALILGAGASFALLLLGAASGMGMVTTLLLGAVVNARVVILSLRHVKARLTARRNSLAVEVVTMLPASAVSEEEEEAHGDARRVA